MNGFDLVGGGGGGDCDRSAAEPVVSTTHVLGRVGQQQQYEGLGERCRDVANIYGG